MRYRNRFGGFDVIRGLRPVASPDPFYRGSSIRSATPDDRLRLEHRRPEPSASVRMVENGKGEVRPYVRTYDEPVFLVERVGPRTARIVDMNRVAYSALMRVDDAIALVRQVSEAALTGGCGG